MRVRKTDSRVRQHPIPRILHNEEGSGRSLVGDDPLANFDEASEEDEDDDPVIVEARNKLSSKKRTRNLIAFKKVCP